MSDTRSPMQKISDGSGKPPAPAAKRAASIADAWRYDPQMEHLADHPELFDRLDPRTATNYRMSLGSYLNAKELARDLGRDVSGRR